MFSLRHTVAFHLNRVVWYHRPIKNVQGLRLHYEIFAFICWNVRLITVIFSVSFMNYYRKNVEINPVLNYISTEAVQIKMIRLKEANIFDEFI